MKRVLFLLTLICMATFVHAEEQPPFETKDPAMAEDLRQIYYTFDGIPISSAGAYTSKTYPATYCDQLASNGNSKNGIECFINGVLVFQISGGDFELYPDTTQPNVFLQGALASGMPTLQPRSSGGTNPWGLGTSTFKWVNLYLSSGIVGTTTNDNAPSGYVGEYLSSNTASNVPFAATNVYSDLLSLPLTAGDWDVTGEALASLNGATCTNWELAISPTSGNSTTGLSYGINRWDLGPPAATADNKLEISNYRVSISGSATYYLKIRNTCSAGVMFSNGTFHARRPR